MAFSGNQYEVKSIVTVPQWAAEQMRGDVLPSAVNSPASAYSNVPLIYRATRIRANSLIQVPHHIKDSQGNDVDWMFKTSLDNLLWQIQASLLLTGGAFILKQQNRVRVVDIELVNPFTMAVEWDAKNSKRIFSQRVNGTRIPASGYWTEDDIVFIREFSPIDDVGFGVSSAQVALMDAGLAFNLSKFASDYFKNGAMPVTIVSIVGQKTKEELAQIQNFFQRALSGIRNANRVLAVNGEDTKFASTQSALKDLATPELSDQARKDIARAFELPITLLDSDATYATASVHQKQYYRDSVLPTATRIAEELNRQLLNPMGYSIEFNAEEMDIFQEDEASRASSLGSLVSAIENAKDPDHLRAAMMLLGYDIPDDVEPLLFKPKAEPKVEQAEQPKEQPLEQPTEEQTDEAGKTLEKKQYREFTKRRLKAGKSVSGFTFKYLNESEQAALKGEAISSGVTPTPFQEYRDSLNTVSARPSQSS